MLDIKKNKGKGSGVITPVTNGKGRRLLHCRWWLRGGRVVFLGLPGHHYNKADGILFAECHAITSLRWPSNLHGFAPRSYDTWSCVSSLWVVSTFHAKQCGLGATRMLPYAFGKPYGLS